MKVDFPMKNYEGLFEDSVKPYRFEPTCMEDELQIMTVHSYENIMGCSSSPNEMSWCKCSYCVSNVNIDVKYVVKMPTVSHRRQPSLMFALIKTFCRQQWGLGESSDMKH